MSSAERFLREGMPLPAASRALPGSWREVALRAGLSLRWRRWRGRVRHNLAAFHEAGLDLDPLLLISSLASNMASVVSAGASLDEIDRWTCRTEGSEALVEAAMAALHRGRGLVIAAPHLGFWHLPLHLLCGAAPVWLLDPSSGRLRRVGGLRECRSRRREWSVTTWQIVSADDSWGAANEALARNEIVAVLPDLARRFPWSEPGRFLGRYLRLPAAPAVLSQRSHAPLLAVCCTLEGRGARLRITEPPIRHATVAAANQRVYDLFAE